MIRASSDLSRLGDSVRLFNLYIEDAEKQQIRRLFQDMKLGPNFTVNFFRDGWNYYGEALLGSCVLTRQMGQSPMEVAKSVAEKVRHRTQVIPTRACQRFIR